MNRLVLARLERHVSELEAVHADSFAPEQNQDEFQNGVLKPRMNSWGLPIEQETRGGAVRQLSWRQRSAQCLEEPPEQVQET